METFDLIELIDQYVSKKIEVERLLQHNGYIPNTIEKELQTYKLKLANGIERYTNDIQFKRFI